jgi:hypothetical protein
MTTRIKRIALCLSRQCPTRLILFVLLAIGTLLTPSPVWCQLVPGSVDVHWNEGVRGIAPRTVGARQE